MLLELWERVRGYDKWTEAEATIKSSEVKNAVVGHDRHTDEPLYAWQSDDEIAWTDQSGQPRSEPISVNENSPLFKHYDGQSVTVRYNSAAPSEFYVREQLRDSVHKAGKIVLGAFCAIALITVLGFVFLHD